MYTPSKISPESQNGEQNVPEIRLDQTMVEHSIADSSTRRSSAIYPKNILIFDERDPNYYIFTLIHAKKDAIATEHFGLL